MKYLDIYRAAVATIESGVAECRVVVFRRRIPTVAMEPGGLIQIGRGKLFAPMKWFDPTEDEHGYIVTCCVQATALALWASKPRHPSGESRRVVSVETW